MSLQNKRQKDSAMAAMMKALGIERPGRIDLSEHIGMIQEPEARAMAKSFMNGGFEEEGPWFRSTVLDKLPMSAADLQGILLAKQNEQGRLQ